MKGSTIAIKSREHGLSRRPLFHRGNQRLTQIIVTATARSCLLCARTYRQTSAIEPSSRRHDWMGVADKITELGGKVRSYTRCDLRGTHRRLSPTQIEHVRNLSRSHSKPYGKIRFTSAVLPRRQGNPDRFIMFCRNGPNRIDRTSTVESSRLEERPMCPTVVEMCKLSGIEGLEWTLLQPGTLKSHRRLVTHGVAYRWELKQQSTRK